MAFLAGYAQVQSFNGNELPPKNDIRILMVFVEIEFDINPQNDSVTSPGWVENSLPNKRNEIFDSQVSTNPTGVVTKYFKDASFGTYNVLGDYISQIFTLKESELVNLWDNTIINATIDSINNMNNLNLRDNSLDSSSFDLIGRNSSRKL